MRHIDVRLSVLRFGARISLLTENPCSTAPESGSTLMETEKQTKNFFRGDGRRGQSGHLWLAISHPWPRPLPLTQGPPSWRTLIAHKKFLSPTQGEKVGCQSPTLAFLCQPHREGPPSWSTLAISYPSNLHTRQVKELKLAPWIGDYPGLVHDSFAPYSTTRA